MTFPVLSLYHVPYRVHVCPNCGGHNPNQSLDFNRSQTQHIILFKHKKMKKRLRSDTSVRTSVISVSGCGRRDNGAYCTQFRPPGCSWNNHGNLFINHELGVAGFGDCVHIFSYRNFRGSTLNVMGMKTLSYNLVIPSGEINKVEK